MPFSTFTRKRERAWFYSFSSFTEPFSLLPLVKVTSFAGVVSVIPGIRYPHRRGMIPATVAAAA
jgi:hypothetical protein